MELRDSGYTGGVSAPDSSALRAALLVLLLMACSGSDTRTGSGVGGSAGAVDASADADAVDASADADAQAGGSGGTSGDGGTGGTGAIDGGGSVCKEGAPCKQGETCSYRISSETNGSCSCDPSSHYMCSWSGGAGFTGQCSESQVCLLGETCKKSNGYCDYICSCEAGACHYECGDAGGT